MIIFGTLHRFGSVAKLPEKEYGVINQKIAQFAELAG